jgi:hypothetical protein
VMKQKNSKWCFDIRKPCTNRREREKMTTGYHHLNQFKRM